ncbi:hypothetical protein L596_023797 [Steinernema carpocapsae]|uniref:Uncharacterized protein n=1 Tax=Steinernema carpocapsae TaxID=34508 RepID=A0A4U5MET6_STECR|nr:hypothetical protein L596_023797 [Steinernema carpocapsae]
MKMHTLPNVQSPHDHIFLIDQNAHGPNVHDSPSKAFIRVAKKNYEIEMITNPDYYAVTLILLHATFLATILILAESSGKPIRYAWAIDVCDLSITAFLTAQFIIPNFDGIVSAFIIVALCRIIENR